MTSIETTFKNELCFISLNQDKTFSGRDYTDMNNEPRMYTKNTRSYKKGLALLKEKFNEKTTMYEVARLLSEIGLSARTYCSID